MTIEKKVYLKRLRKSPKVGDVSSQGADSQTTNPPYSAPDTTNFAITKLKNHPLQAKTFTPQPEHEFEEFVLDIQTHGLREPIEILTDGTIISGHERVRAAKKLGWPTIPAVIRTDLTEAGDEAAREEFLFRNTHRRQLGALGKLRALLVARGLEPTDRERSSDGILSESLGRDLGLQARQVRTLLSLLDLPLPVQDAIDQGKVTQRIGCQLLRVDEEWQKHFVSALANADTLAECVNELSEATRISQTDDDEDNRARKLVLQLVRLASDVKLSALRKHIDKDSDEHAALIRLSNEISKAFRPRCKKK